MKSFNKLSLYLLTHPLANAIYTGIEFALIIYLTILLDISWWWTIPTIIVLSIAQGCALAWSMFINPELEKILDAKD